MLLYRFATFIGVLTIIIYLANTLCLLINICSTPDSWNDGKPLFIFALIFFASLEVGVLYCRDTFDLINMTDGTNKASQFIWSIFAIAWGCGLVFMFLRDILGVLPQPN